MSTYNQHGPVPVERYRTIVIVRWPRSSIVWEDALGMRLDVPRHPIETVHYSEIGPGWALLVVRLERRLRREGAPPETWPRLIALGAGQMAFVLPVRAPRWVHRMAQAMSRLALRCCEICLRGPVSCLTVHAIGAPETLRLCAWHYDRLVATRLPSSVRVEAWELVQYGAGPLRTMLLGGRLSPGGVEVAFERFGAAQPTKPGGIGCIPDDLVIHALDRLAPATLAGMRADALLPLLADRNEHIRQAAVMAMARVHGGTAAAASGEGLPEDGSADASAAGTSHSAIGSPAPGDAAQQALDRQRADDCGQVQEQYALPRPTYRLVDVWLVDTASGSQYVIVHDADRVWWLGGRNVATIRSAPLPRGCLYQLQYPTPWPPVLGETLMLLPPPHLSSWDPARVPGGGKHTSKVVSITPILPEPDLSPYSNGGSALSATDALAVDGRGVAEHAEADA